MPELQKQEKVDILQSKKVSVGKYDENDEIKTENQRSHAKFEIHHEEVFPERKEISFNESEKSYDRNLSKSGKSQYKLKK